VDGVIELFPLPQDIIVEAAQVRGLLTCTFKFKFKFLLNDPMYVGLDYTAMFATQRFYLLKVLLVFWLKREQAGNGWCTACSSRQLQARQITSHRIAEVYGACLWHGGVANGCNKPACIP
jgi:hypothetical protein